MVFLKDVVNAIAENFDYSNLEANEITTNLQKEFKPYTYKKPKNIWMSHSYNFPLNHKVVPRKPVH